MLIIKSTQLQDYRSTLVWRKFMLHPEAYIKCKEELQSEMMKHKCSLYSRHHDRKWYIGNSIQEILSSDTLLKFKIRLTDFLW